MALNILVPESGESVVEATVGPWHKKEGDFVNAGDPLVELETDKVNLEVAAEKAGVLVKIERQTGEDVQVGDVLGTIEEGDTPADDKPTAEKPAETKATDDKPSNERKVDSSNADSDGKATPMAKRVAEEHSVDLAQVNKKGERITRHDVESYLDQQKEQPQPEKSTSGPEPKQSPSPSTPTPAVKSGPSASAGRPESRQKMSRRRRTIAQRLLEAQHSTAMLTTFNEIDMSAVLDLRKRRQETFVNRHDIKLGFMSFFTKAGIGALKAFPALNAEIDGDDIVYKEYYDIGIAVGSAEGLVVPVVRNADRLTFAGIEKTIKGFAEKVNDNTLSLEDLRGGTFTITNGGIFGSMLSTPILNPPQVGHFGPAQNRQTARSGGR